MALAWENTPAAWALHHLCATDTGPASVPGNCCCWSASLLFASSASVSLHLYTVTSTAEEDEGEEGQEEGLCTTQGNNDFFPSVILFTWNITLLCAGLSLYTVVSRALYLILTCV